MSNNELKKLLEKIKAGELSVDDALGGMKDLPFKDLGHTMLDNHRELRNGYPEVIYAEGKTIEQVLDIMEAMNERGSNILATRASEEMYLAVEKKFKKAKYNKLARTIVIKNKDMEGSQDYIAIVAAGTSDLPVVEEAYETARILGNKVKKVTDVGVAGIHRLFSRMDEIKNAKVVIVVAGMEGALASVVGGLVDKPVIAVPTSVGYGASFGGVSALLTMLNSCASGVSVVNIDNGFGAAYNASIINNID